MPLTSGGQIGYRLDEHGNRVVEFPISNFLRLTEGAISLDGEDGKHLICEMNHGMWPSQIERLEFFTIEGGYETEIHVTIFEKNASAEIALPEKPTAEQLAAARGETITQMAPNGFEVGGSRATPPTPQDWRPF